jgi:hypothetical protein
MKNNKSGGEQMLELREPAGAWSPAPLYSHECEAQDREHLRKFLQSVRRRWWLALGIVALCTVLTALYMSRQPDVYEAEAQVQVDLENINAAVASSKAGAFAVNPVNDPAYFNTQLQILTRASLLRRVVRTLNLERDPEFNLARINQPFSFGGRAFAAGSTLSAAAPTVAYTGQNAQLTPADTNTETAGLAQENLDEAARLAPYVEMIRSNLKVEPVKETRLPSKKRASSTSLSATRIRRPPPGRQCRRQHFRPLESGAENRSQHQHRRHPPAAHRRTANPDSQSGNATARLRQKPPDSLARCQPEHSG